MDLVCFQCWLSTNLQHSLTNSGIIWAWITALSHHSGFYLGHRSVLHQSRSIFCTGKGGSKGKCDQRWAAGIHGQLHRWLHCIQFNWIIWGTANGSLRKAIACVISKRTWLGLWRTNQTDSGHSAHSIRIISSACLFKLSWACVCCADWTETVAVPATFFSSQCWLWALANRN